ncbi:MAG: type I-C CRISPR-associated endonuclease Cas1c [Neomegalonema sp.]|nr:type I-C CRISPR-associated endonuclease Cas1c [Neomegalonema sp.]
MRRDGANVVVEIDGRERGRAPLHLLGSIVCFARAGLSPRLLGECATSGITVSYFSEYGRFLARVEGPVSGNVFLRKAQHRLQEDESRAAIIARSFVIGKLLNQREVLRRAVRDYGAEDQLTKAQERLQFSIERLRQPFDIETLRGIEGEGARVYFGAFDGLIRGDRENFYFKGRSRRPPLDRVNALLSFLYSLLTADCRSALEGVGLDPAVGFLHALRAGRPSLALDLTEEFRPVIADRLALSLINRRQVSARDFRVMENGATLLTEDGRKAVLIAWQERKREERLHPYLQEKAPIGLFPHLQAQLLARHLRGDLDAYPPCIWK